MSGGHEQPVKRVVVIGGGVMGSAAAWQLASRGIQVRLLEQYEPGHDRGSSHGTSRIYRLAYPDAFYVGLAARALPLWRQAEAESGRAVLSLTGAVDHGPAAAIEALYAALRGGGHPATILRPEEAAERWPGLRFDTSVLFHPTAGRVHAGHAVLAFQRAAVLKGAVISPDTRVASVNRTGRTGVEVVTIDGEVHLADAVVIAIGGWAPGLAAASIAGIPPLRVTQEQPLHFPAPDALRWPSFIHHGGAALGQAEGVYGLGSVDGVKVGFHGVGPVVDPDARDRSIDPVALRQIQAYAETWLPGVSHADPVAATCLYTTTPDHDFIVDRDGPVTVLAGFSGHGFKFAPAIGQIAADLVQGADAPERFRTRRFANR